MAAMNTGPPMRSATPELLVEDEAGGRNGSNLPSEPADLTSFQNARLQTQPTPLTPAQRHDIMRAQARAIDEQLEDHDASENLATVVSRQGDFRGLVFEPDITPNDPNWETTHRTFQNDLTNKAISTVLDENFEDWQKSLLLPPERSEAIVEVQARNKIKYDELRNSPQFASTQNNAILKLTMAHFGLPVEPFTMNNVMNAGTDADDEADPEPEPPRVQRIIYAEKPLEFLDSYHERSYGFPMLRRPVHLRGGSGGGVPMVNIPPLVKNYWLYENGGFKSEIKKSASTADEHAQFERIVKMFLGLDEKSTGKWECVVDQYREEIKKQKSFTRAFRVDSENDQSLWRDFLQPRVFNLHGSWIMVIRPPRGPTVPAPEKFTVNGHIFKPKKPTGTGVANTGTINTGTANTGTANTGTIQPPVPHGAISKTIWAISGKNKTLTLSKPLKVANIRPPFIDAFTKEFRSNDFILVFYSKRLHGNVNPAIWEHDFRIIFNSDNHEESWQLTAPLLFGKDAKKRWVCVAYQHAGLIEDTYPQNASKPTMPQPPTLPNQSAVPGEVPIWTISSATRTVGYNIKNSADDFRNTALTVLGIDPSKVAAWNFRVDMYSWVFNVAQGASSLDTNIPFQCRIRVDQTDLQEVFTDFIAPRLFGTSAPWSAVIRQTTQPVVGAFTKGRIVSLPGTRPTTSTIIQSPSYGGTIFGYAGQLRCSNQQSLFIQAAKDLLTIEDSASANWEFQVDIFTGGTFIGTYHISRSQANVQFAAIQTPHLNQAGWTVFVRIGGLLPIQLEPPADVPNIVKLECAGRGTAYWKIWRDSAKKQTQAGINQFQPGFQRAMKVLFPSRESSPAARVRITTNRPLLADNDTFELAVGGLELILPILDSLKFELEEFGDPSLPQDLRWTVQLFNAAGISPGPGSTAALGAGPASDIAVGIHLPGSHMCETAEGPEEHITRILGDRISEISDARVSNKPESFRLWYSAKGREKVTPYKLIRYGRGSDLGSTTATDIRTFFDDSFTTEGACTYVWFRPEYPIVRIIEDGNTSSGAILWDCSRDSSLKSFRAELEKLFSRGGPSANTRFFKVVVSGAPGPNQEFTIDPDTSEDEWRLHVFDALRSDNVSVVRTLAFQGITADIDTSTPWGVLQSRTLPVQTRSITSARSHTGGFPTPPNTQLSRIKMATQRFNKERILKAQVTRAVPQQWDPWVQETSRLDRLKQTSYVRDQSVIEPGQKPEPPIFGPSKELLLSVGTDMPQSYAQRLTPTDIMQLRDENQRLRNHILEREDACFLCDASFPKHRPEEKRAHFKLHTDAYATGPTMCPWCFDPNWAFWSPKERKAHLETDFVIQRDKEKKATLQDVFCPICHKDLNGLKTEHVLAHIAGHTPDVLKWCDRCGRDNTTMDPVEISYHKRVCIDALPRDITAAPHKFCGSCGQDVTKLTDKQFQDHQASTFCRSGIGEFCTVCALDLSLIHSGLTVDHELNCRPPSGPPRRFCNRCGVNEWELDDRGKACHKNDCLSRDPRPFKDQKRLDEITRKIRQEGLMRAKNLRERMELNKLRDRIKKMAPGLTEGGCDDLQERYDLLMDQYDQLKQKLADSEGDDPFGDPFDCPFPACKESIAFASATKEEFKEHFRTHILDQHGDWIHRRIETFFCRLSKQDDPDTICNEEVAFDKPPADFEPVGAPIETHDEHIREKHPIIFECPIIKADGKRCGEKITQNYKDVNLIVDHLRKEHPAAGAGAAAKVLTIIDCTQQRDNGAQCTESIPCTDGGEAYKNHLQEQHPRALFFYCPLLRANGERCMNQIFYPIGDQNIELFRGHYSHHIDDLVGMTNEQVMEHVRTQGKILEDIAAKLKPATDGGNPIPDGGGVGTDGGVVDGGAIFDGGSLGYDDGGVFDRGAIVDGGSLASDGGVVDGGAVVDGRQPRLGVGVVENSGFAPSPTSPDFPERKRKYDEALRERARKPGEPIQEYSQRLKRMRTAVPKGGRKRAREAEVEDENEEEGLEVSDESEKSGTRRSARMIAKKARKSKGSRKW